MPTIKEINQENMKLAMKAGEKEKLQYIRNLHAAIRKKEIDDRVDMDDAGIVKLISGMIKQREESIAQFTAGNRLDLVAAEEGEAKYLRQYMPAQMPEAELKAMIADCVKEADAKDIKDLGKVMKLIQPKVAGKADGKLVNQFVREALGG